MSHPTTSSPWQRLAQQQIDPLYLLCGEELYLVQHYTTLLVERILGKAARDFNYNTFQAVTTPVDEVLSVACTLPVMTTHRVVVFHGMEHLKKAEWQQMVTYLQRPSESTALICSGRESDPRKYPTEIWERAQLISCAALEGSALRQWVSKAAKQWGCRIDPEALHTFLQEQEPDLWMLEQEIRKLCTYVGEHGHITLQDVQAVSQGLRHHSIFALSEALGTRQAAVALSKIEHLLNQGEPPLVILSMMIRHLRLLWGLKQLTQQQYELPRAAKMLGIPLAVCRRLATQKFSVSALQQLYTAALEADVTCKSSNKPPKAVLEELILKLCEGAYV